MSFVYSSADTVGNQDPMADVNGRTADVTRLLAAWSSGRGDALDKLLPVVYDELRRMARGQLANARQNHTFQATDLVHEAFLRLVDQRASWQSRVHFYGIAATCMRRVLADYARRRKAVKRPQIDAAIDIDDLQRAGAGGFEHLLAFDEALDRLSAADPRQARIAELKVFAGLQVDEIASLLAISPATVKRDWTAAKQTLHAILTEHARDAR
jgi:RNA polymerase sigma-70 factor, ECF subfamily